MPSSGGAGIRRRSRDHATHLSCASSSRRQKYQWPFRCALKSDTSPRTHSGMKAPSSTSLAVAVNATTDTAAPGDAPGIASSTYLAGGGWRDGSRGGGGGTARSARDDDRGWAFGGGDCD